MNGKLIFQQKKTNLFYQEIEQIVNSNYNSLDNTNDQIQKIANQLHLQATSAFDDITRKTPWSESVNREMKKKLSKLWCTRCKLKGTCEDFEKIKNRRRKYGKKKKRLR